MPAAVRVLAFGVCALGCMPDFDSLSQGPAVQAGSGGAAGSGGTDAGGASGAGGATAGAGGEPDAGGGGSSGTGSVDAGVENLLLNGDFESPALLWSPVGQCMLQLDTTDPHGGSNCLFVSGRTKTWEGPGYPLTAVVSPGKVYRVSLWAKSAAEAASMTLTYKRRCEGDPADGVFTQLVTVAVSTTWTELSGLLSAAPCTPLEALLYVEASLPELSFFIDDARVEEVEL